MFSKRCAQCRGSFPRLGSKKGGCGLLGRVLGMLTVFLLFGGTSKYCPECRKSIKEEGGKLDKGFLFRVIWFLLAALILFAIAMAA